MNSKIIRFLATVILFTTLNVFIITFFSLDIPLEILLDKLGSNLIFAIISGILVSIAVEWSLKKVREGNNEKEF